MYILSLNTLSMPLTAYSITPKPVTHGGQILKSGQLIEEIYNQTFTQDLTPGDYVLCRSSDQIDLLHYLETVGLKLE